MDKVLSIINSCGVVSICRGVYGEDLEKLSDALYAGGLRAIEVTFAQSDPDCIEKTSAAIAALRARHEDMAVGAGTVLTAAQAEAAYKAGACFIVSPNTDTSIIARTKELGMVSIPGAMTPSEIMCAYNAGANIVKLFPAASLGLAYLKDIRAPISHIPLMATGGINTENFSAFLKGGCCCAGIGSYLSDKKLIAAGDWAAFERRAAEFVSIYREVAML